MMLKEFFMKCKEACHKAKLLYSDWAFLCMFSNDKKKAEVEVCFSLLRKDCHILDKGLHTVPFEKGHGKAFYAEAVSLKKKLENTPVAVDPAFHWCKGVISTYECAQSCGTGKKSMSYHVYTEDERLVIDEFFRSRVSCRNFNAETIDDAIWNKIIEIAADAPNGCCRQTSRIYVVHEKETIAKLRVNIGGATGFSNEIPYLLCITADTRPYMCIDRTLAYIDASLFAGNLVLACRANNKFTTILNFQHASHRERKAVSACLNIPSHEQVILFIAAGHADAVPEKPTRMSVGQFRKL